METTSNALLTQWSQGSFPDHPHLSDEMQKVVRTAAQKLLPLFASPEWQAVFQLKTASLFLLNNRSERAQSWMKLHDFGSSLMSSLEMIRFIEKIANDEHLHSSTKESLQRWIAAEKRYLPYAVALDALRLNHASSLLLSSNHKAVKDSCLALTYHLASRCPIDDALLDILAQQIFSQMQKASPTDDPDKLLSGIVLHEARLRFTRQKDGNFELIQFEPNDSTAHHWENTPLEKLSQDFWRKMVKAKLRETDMRHDIFRETLGAGKNCLELAGKKKKQKTNSCPMNALIRDIKYEIIKNSPTEEEGYLQYKIVKALIGSALKNEGITNPLLKTLVSERVQEKELYFYWEQCARQPEGAQLYEHYRAALAARGVVQHNAYPTTIPQRVKMLRDMDRQLHKYMKRETASKLDSFILLHFPLPFAEHVCLKLRHYKQSQENIIAQAFSEIRRKSVASTIDSFLRRGVVQLQNVLDQLPSMVHSVASLALSEAWTTLSIAHSSQEEMKNACDHWIKNNLSNPQFQEQIDALYHNGFISDSDYKQYCDLAEKINQGWKKLNEEDKYNYFSDLTCQDPENFHFFPEELKNDQDFVARLVCRSERLFNELPIQLQSDYDFVMNCVKKNPARITCVPEKFKKDKNIAKTIFTTKLIAQYIKNPSSKFLINYLHTELKNDSEFVFALFQEAAKQAAYPYIFSEESLERWAQQLKVAPQLFTLFPTKMQHDTTLIYKALALNKELFNFLPQELKADNKILSFCATITTPELDV